MSVREGHGSRGGWGGPSRAEVGQGRLRSKMGKGCPTMANVGQDGLRWAKDREGGPEWLRLARMGQGGLR